MFKLYLTLLAACVLLSTSSFAEVGKIHEQRLKEKYGNDLRSVPFVVRYAYNERYDKGWDNTDYTERKEFLDDYDIETALQKAHDRALAKADAKREKDYLLAKKEDQVKARNRLRMQQEEDKAENEDYKDRIKNFDEVIKGQQKELQQMEGDFESAKQQNSR